MGRMPWLRLAMRSSFTSRQTTRWPRSARQVPVTRPTYPTPITAMFFIVQFLSFPGFDEIPPKSCPAVNNRILPLIELARNQPGGAAADLDRVIGAAIPGIHLRHGSEIESRDRRADVRDIPGMIDGRDGLRVRLAEQPRLLDPRSIETGIEARERRRKPIE